VNDQSMLSANKEVSLNGMSKLLIFGQLPTNSPAHGHPVLQDQKEERPSFLRPWLPAYLRDQPFEYQLVEYQAFATMAICALIAVWSMVVLVLRSHQGK
jgi:hypothetical protein